MAPGWAVALVSEVCADAGVAEPSLRWRRAARVASSGVTRWGVGSVAVTSGSDPVDERLTLLHELAHWVAPQARRRRGRIAHHDAAFYAVAFRLYERHGIPAPEALAREGGRYPSSLRHARTLGVPGADTAWHERRVALRERARLRRPVRVLVPEHTVRLVRDGRWTRCGVCGVRIVGPVLVRLRKRSGRHLLLGTG
ncbi:MAG: hypothetical protein OEW24_03825 [Chloroflexota bacterium]|nr:hypothetical protein [Chloroflexota bacterium]